MDIAGGGEGDGLRRVVVVAVGKGDELHREGFAGGGERDGLHRVLCVCE